MDRLELLTREEEQQGRLEAVQKAFLDPAEGYSVPKGHVERSGVYGGFPIDDAGDVAP